MTIRESLYCLPHFIALGCIAALLSACSSGGGSSGGNDNPNPPGGSSSSTTSSGSTTSSSSSSSSGLTLGECEDQVATVCGDFDHDDEPTPGEGDDTPPLPAGWTIDKSEGTTVTFSDEQTHSGAQSIKFVSTGGGYNRAFLTIDLSKTPPLQQEMFGRMMVYLTDENENGGDFTFLQAEGSVPQEASGAPEGTLTMYSGRIDQRYDHIFTNYDTFHDADDDNESDWQTDCWNQPPFTNAPPPPQFILPKNEWVCVQWHIEQSTNHIDISVKENELSGIRVYDTGDGCAHPDTQGGIWYTPQNFERLHLGIEQYSEESLPRTMYIDDITLDSDLVRCDGTLTTPNH